MSNHSFITAATNHSPDLRVTDCYSPVSQTLETLFAVPFRPHTKPEVGDAIPDGLKGIQVPVPLSVLATKNLQAECWQVTACNQPEGISQESWQESWPHVPESQNMPQAHWQQALSPQFMLLALDWDENQRVQPLTSEKRAAITESVYQQAITHAAAQGYDTLLRSWNYLPGITRRYGELDGYQLFCRGRELARNSLQANGLFTQSQHPAATAIGTENGRWQFVFLFMYGSEFRALENPRQVPAWQYPEKYSPSKPTFARAVMTPSALLCSGTASVLGHASAHENNVIGQCRESLRNIQALLEQAEGTPGAPDSLSVGKGIYRVYVRHGVDTAAVTEVLCAEGIQRFVVLRGDICRNDLLVECEAAFDLGEKKPHGNPLC